MKKARSWAFFILYAQSVRCYRYRNSAINGLKQRTSRHRPQRSLGGSRSSDGWILLCRRSRTPSGKFRLNESERRLFNFRYSHFVPFAAGQVLEKPTFNDESYCRRSEEHLNALQVSTTASGLWLSPVRNASRNFFSYSTAFFCSA